MPCTSQLLTALVAASFSLRRWIWTICVDQNTSVFTFVSLKWSNDQEPPNFLPMQLFSYCTATETYSHELFPQTSMCFISHLFPSFINPYIEIYLYTHAYTHTWQWIVLIGDPCDLWVETLSPIRDSSIVGLELLHQQNSYQSLWTVSL